MSMKSAGQVNSETLAGELVASFDSFGYMAPLRHIEEALLSTVWIVGGWPRSKLLGRGTYVGDVDCLTPLPPERIAKLAASSAIELTPNLAGGFRLRMHDGNHVDISSVQAFNGSLSVQEALGHFNVSVNAVAVNLSTSQILAHEAALRDLQQGYFRFLRPGKCPADEAHEIRTDVEALINFYGLRPRGDSRTRRILNALDAERTRFSAFDVKVAIKWAETQLEPLIPPGARGWIVRGYTRCAMLRELCFWDDVDVVVACTQATLAKHLSDHRFNLILNFHNGPKVRLPSGLSVDIWSIGDAGDVKDELGSYQFNVDSIAWSLYEHNLVDPIGVARSIEARELRTKPLNMNLMNKRSTSYLAVKAAYLSLRHDLSPADDCTVALLKSPLTYDGLLLKNTTRLARELACTSAQSSTSIRAAKLRALVDVSPGLNLLLSQQS